MLNYYVILQTFDPVKKMKKLVRRVEPTKQYTKSQNKYAPETKQLKIKGVKYTN